MNVGTKEHRPECDAQVDDAGVIRVRTETADAETVIDIDPSSHPSD